MLSHRGYPGNDMNHVEVMGNELKALMHQYSIEMTHILLQHMFVY